MLVITKALILLNWKFGEELKRVTLKMERLFLQIFKRRGSGTHGRKWYTYEKNIAFSFVIEPNCEIQKLEGITIEIAETIVEVFQALYNISLAIKFPNDLVYQGKKIGGILTETKLKGKKVRYVVIGIGINTNQEIFDEEIRDIASSIKKEFNIEVNTQKVMTEFCNLFETKMIHRLVI